MKRLRYLVISCSLLFGVLLALNSCENQPEELIIENTDISVITLQEATPMGDIVLPKGTKVIEVSEGKIDIKLPFGYKFLLFDKNDGVSFSESGGYSCTCSAQNSCKVFYTKKEGYGCLQNSCTGSCTGTPTDGGGIRTAYGIINSTSDHLLGENFVAPGNLTSEGYDIFMEYVVKDELKEFFDFAYMNSKYKNGVDLIAQKGIESTTQVLLQYKGISFSAVVPNFDDVAEDQIIDFQRGVSVTCTGSDGCTCKKSKKCLLGNCVYFCDGCTTCTITVNEK